MSYKIDLHLGDCLEILPTLAAGSVDAVVTDVPYGTTQCKWDEVIPLDEMWEQVKRLTGVFITTASQPFTSALVMSNLDWFRYSMVWNKVMVTGIANAKIMPLKSHEDICVFGRNGITYNPQKTGKASKPFGKLSGTKSPVIGELGTDYQVGVGYPKSIVRYPRPNNITGGGFHTTQKPVELYEYLIKTYTNEGDIVLDFCFGSGTTGVACVQTGRNFIGVEIEPKYFEIAEKRIAEAQLQMRMPI